MDRQKPSWFDPHLEDGLDQTSRDAIAWFNLLGGDQVSNRDRAAFRAWLRRDPAHPLAFQQVEQFWSGLSQLPEARRRKRGLTRRRLVKGVAVLALAGGAFGAYRFHPFADYRTGTGERRTIALSDGSRIELAASTAVSADLDGATRLVTLHSGEAYFDVASDAARPFAVETGRGRVTALGTAFAIADESQRTVVTVTEHAVRVEAAARSLRIDAGLQTEFDAASIDSPKPFDVNQALAWREGRLVFVNARLDRVIRELNRWRTGRLVIMNAALAAQFVTLIVNLEDIESALRQLQDALPLAQTNVTPLLTLLHAR